MKKKGCLIAALGTAAALTVLLAYPYWRPVLLSDPDIALICADHFDSNLVCAVSGTCYHAESKGVFCGEQCVLSSSRMALIDENGGMLYVCDGQEITCYDAGMQAVCSYTLPEQPSYFNAAEHEILWYDAKDLCHVWNIASAGEAHAEQKEWHEDDMTVSVSYYQDFIICSVWSERSQELYGDEGVCSAAFLDGRCVYEPLSLADKLSLRQFLALKQDELVLSAPMNQIPRKIQRMDLKQMKMDSSANIASEFYGCAPFLSADASDRYITLVWTDEWDPHSTMQDYRRVKDTSCETVMRIDRGSFTADCSHTTREHEKIIYADDSKTVTYYKGKYYVYATADWTVFSQQKAKGLEAGKTYRFVPCGQELLVLNADTGQLTEQIGF